MARSKNHHDTEWLSLVEISGPFLSLPVLQRVFPQGLDAHDPAHAALLRLAYQEWADDATSRRPDPAIHTAWLRFVLGQTLGLPGELVLEGPAVPLSLSVTVAEHHETLRPTSAVVNPDGDERAGTPRLLIQVYPAGQNLEGAIVGQALEGVAGDADGGSAARYWCPPRARDKWRAVDAGQRAAG